MIFTENKLPGVFSIEPERLEDERGFFARVFCIEEFAAQGLETRFVQSSVSFNAHKRTLRGMHYQAAPHEETKLVRCTIGAAFHALVDLRPQSTAFKQWCGIELSAENRRSIYIPAGLAHGFITLEDNTEIFYQMTESHHPECARGVRWNDPAFGIQWPHQPEILSDNDRAYSNYCE